MFAPSIFAVPSRAGRKSFTLVEMLVVMGILAILLTVLLPAIRGLSQASGARGAVDTLMGALDRARMTAISDGLNTYVVFACPSATGTSPLRPDLLGHAYAIYEDQDNVSFSPQQKTPWIQLPVGVALKINDGSASNDGSGPYPSVTAQPLQTGVDPAFPVGTGVLAPGATGTVSTQLPYWKFDATGAAMVPGYPKLKDYAYLRALLFPGFINAQGVEVATQNIGGKASNTNVVQFQEIDVNPVTGRAMYNVEPTNNVTPTPSP